MSEITRAFEFVIMAAGSTTTADMTFATDDFIAPPEYSRWSVDIFEATAESVPFEVTIRDTSEQVTGNLSDSGGRADLIGRFWRLRVNENGGGLATVAQGRISGIKMAPSIGAYTFLCGDEMYRMRNWDLFQSIATPTTQVWPPGLRDAWYQQFEAAGEAELEVVSTDTSRSDSKAAVHLIANIGTRYDLSPAVIEWIKQDRKYNAKPGATGDNTGHHTYLRFLYDGDDYEVIGFGFTDTDPDVFGPLDDEGEGGTRRILNLWIAWDEATPAVSQPTAGDFIRGALYAPGAPASDVLPYHVGGDDGVDLLDWLKDLLDGASIEYDSNAFDTWDASTNPNGLLANPKIPFGWLRITEPMRLSDVAARLMKTFLLAPFANSTGQFYPRTVGLPFGINVAALPEVTAAKLSIDGHPTWYQRGNAAVTVIKGRIDSYRAASAFFSDNDWPADRIIASKVDLPVQEHDRVDEVGRHVYEVDYWGPAGVFYNQQQAREIFDRFGDGPIYGVWQNLSALDGVQQGDFVLLTLSSYPDMATQTRGGTRLVQVLDIVRTVYGDRMEYLDAGTNAAALSAPGVSIAQNSSRPKHDVDVTISSLPAGADAYMLQLKIGSGQWYTAGIGTANETVTISNLPSNTTILARAASTASAQTRSAWSSTSSVATDPLTAPTGVTATINGTTVVVTWTNTETEYVVQPLIDGVVELVWSLKPGSTRYVRNGLAASTSTVFGVRYRDPYGGVSATATDTETTGTAQTLTAPLALVNRQRIVVDDVYPADNRFGTGIEVGIVRAEPHAKVQVQVDTSSSFSAPTSYFFEGRDVARIHLPLDGVTRYVRARHRLDGFTASAWTETLSMVPAPFASTESVTMTDLRTKTLRIDAAAFQPVSGATTDYLHQIGYLSPTGTSARAFVAPFSLPVGCRITAIRTRTWFNNTGSSIQIVLYQQDADLTATPASLANDTQVGTAGHVWVEDLTVDHVVAVDESFRVFANITNSTAGNDARLGFVELTYEAPSGLISQ